MSIHWGLWQRPCCQGSPSGRPFSLSALMSPSSTCCFFSCHLNPFSLAATQSPPRKPGGCSCSAPGPHRSSTTHCLCYDSWDFPSIFSSFPPLSTEMLSLFQTGHAASFLHHCCMAAAPWHEGPANSSGLRELLKAGEQFYMWEAWVLWTWEQNTVPQAPLGIAIDASSSFMPPATPN